MEKVVHALRDVLGSDAILDITGLNYATSYWNSKPAHALALVRPGNTAEISAVLKICYQHNQPVVIQGGKTNCVQAAEANNDEIILSLERLNQIESIDPVGCTATVGAGVVLQNLQDACLEQDMLFPLDLGARGSCTIGGNAATNAGGINVLRYGMARNLVLGIEVVLADGSVLSSMNQMLKNNAGYDLKQLFIGSEGTLGIITRIVVRIFPRPVTRCAALLGLNEFQHMVTLLQTARRDLADSLSAFEVMWGEYFRAVTGVHGHRAPMSREYDFYVMLQAEGSDRENDANRFSRFLEQCYENGVVLDAVVPKSDTELRSLWEIRENFESILKPEPVFLYDVSLPVPSMKNYVVDLSNALKKKWPGCEFYVLGHIADGNLHFFIRPNAAGEQLHDHVDEIVYGKLKRFAGSVSAEHGIGMEKRPWLKVTRSTEEINLMNQLKQMLDPKNLLNRGRVLGEFSK